MTYHHWGDEGVDWTGIADAADFIGHFLKKWGRVSVFQTKEKYGTARVYCSFGWSSLLGITHPGWCHYGPYPKWLSYLDIHIFSRIVPFANFVVVPYHKFLYKLAYRKAITKWPHLTNEIVDGADWQELLLTETEKP